MYETKIILDSLAPSGGRLTTFQLTLPRIVLAELNTHRMLSKNSASSRAIPTEKMLARVREDPFVPLYWGKNQKGMQADQELEEQEKREARLEWLLARDHGVTRAEAMRDIGIHKQITNRLLEPFMWHTVVVTATEWSNFFALRDHPMAQPEIRESAHQARLLYESNIPRKLSEGELHLPFVTGYDEDELVRAGRNAVDRAHISIGRCAATSFLRQEDTSDPEKDLTRSTQRLIPNGHMSPTEHVAVALGADAWRVLAGVQAHAWIERRVPVGNFWGWEQWRKKINGEHDFSTTGGAR